MSVSWVVFVAIWIGVEGRLRSSESGLPLEFLAVTRGNESTVLFFLDVRHRRASMLERTGQPIGVECGKRNETVVTVNVGSPCVAQELEGKMCGERVAGGTPCDLLDAWEALDAKGTYDSQGCLEVAAPLGGLAVACVDWFTGDVLSFRYDVLGVNMEFRKPSLLVSVPPSGYVFPANLCKCRPSVPKHVLPPFSTHGAHTSTSFVASVSDESLFFMDVPNDRMTMLSATNQTLGFNCSVGGGGTSYWLDLDSSCHRISSGCPKQSTLNPCAHVDVWRSFFSSPMLNPCTKIQGSYGIAEICIDAASLLPLNYTYAGTQFIFGALIYAPSPESVFPTIPPQFCPCPQS